MDTGQWWPNYNTDHGDFRHNEFAYTYMEQVAPLASQVAAKVYDMESGREQLVDYRRVFKMLKAAGFNGGISVFYKSTYSNMRYDDGIAVATMYFRDLAAEVGL